MHIFLDESGYTGQDLLNGDQRVFVLATLGLSEQECNELKSRHFGRVGSREIKYSSLARRPRQQRMVLRFLREVLDRHAVVKVSFADKRFVLLTKMVDLLTENAMHEDGVDLYENGANVALCNMLHFGLPQVCGDDYCDRLLHAFQNAMRFGTWEAFTNFRRILFDPDLNAEQRDWLAWFQEPVRRWGYGFFAEEARRDALDITLSDAAYLMGLWRFEHRDEPLHLIHDETSNMVSQSHVWEFFMSNERTPFERQYPNGMKTFFPIAAERTEFASSLEWAGLQLADVIAGAFADGGRWALRGAGSDKYRDELWHGVLQEQTVAHRIWPEPRFTAEELGTVGWNPSRELEYIASEMRKVGIADPAEWGKRRRRR